MRLGMLALIAALIAPVSAAGQSNAVVADAIDRFIVPGYERLAAEAELQGLVLRSLCDTPGEAALAAAREQFAALVRAWSSIEVVRFGPIIGDNRLERIFFWPDRRGIGLRQVQAILAERDPSALGVDSLQVKSVAVQGLGALEYVLHGTGAEALAGAEGEFRCAYGTAIADAVHRTARAVEAGWLEPGGIAARMTAPAPEYPDYRSDTEVMREIVGIFVHGFELVRDTRLLPFLGTGDGSDANARLAPFWRSQLTVASVSSNVGGLRSLLILSGLGESLEAADRYAAGAFLFELDNFAGAAAGIDPDLEVALADTEMTARLRYLVILSRSLQNIVVNRIAVALGVSAGFSALDGD
jgi:predicted lipoprotein